MKQIELFNDHFQNYKKYLNCKAQLIIADVPYNIGVNAYASNPAWYKGGDNKNGESELAGREFFDTDKNFRPAEFMHFCSQMLVKEPKNGVSEEDAESDEEIKKIGNKRKSTAPCMILFCAFEQLHYFIELGKRYGFNHYIPLVFRKNFSSQVLKANMKIVGCCEYGLVLYKDKLPKFNNEGRMIFNCIDWVRDNDTPKVHPTQKPVQLLKYLIEIFTDKGDVVKVKEIYEKSIHYANGEYESYATEDFMQPIELTEEVLLKIGFKKDGNNYSLVCGDIEVGFYIDKFKQVLYINVSREKRFYKNELRSYDVKYLHELQNAYYCLTNNELEIEL